MEQNCFILDGSLFLYQTSRRRTTIYTVYDQKTWIDPFVHQIKEVSYPHRVSYHMIKEKTNKQQNLAFLHPIVRMCWLGSFEVHINLMKSKVLFVSCLCCSWLASMVTLKHPNHVDINWNPHPSHISVGTQGIISISFWW